VTTILYTTYSLRYIATCNLVERRYRSAVSILKTEAITSSKRLLIVTKAYESLTTLRNGLRNIQDIKIKKREVSN